MQLLKQFAPKGNDAASVRKAQAAQQRAQVEAESTYTKAAQVWRNAIQARAAVLATANENVHKARTAMQAAKAAAKALGVRVR